MSLPWLISPIKEQRVKQCIEYEQEGGKNCKSLSNNQNFSNNQNSSLKTNCTIKSLISSYSSSKNCSPSKNKTTAYFKTNPLVDKIQNSKKCANFKGATIIRNKQQSCPPLIQKSKSLVAKEVKVRKVYHSEPQSHMLAGVPCAPPVSPVNDVFIAFEIVPSLADIKSQQTVKAKLKNIETARQKQNEKLKALFIKEEKRREKEEKEMLKEQRRAEIYALNDVMTQLERTKFLKFINDKCNGTTTISLKA